MRYLCIVIFWWCKCKRRVFVMKYLQFTRVILKICSYFKWRSKRLLSRRSRQRERLHAMGLSICLLVCLSVCPFAKNAIFSKTKKFRTMVSIDDLGVRTWAFQRTHYWTLNPRWRSSAILDLDAKVPKRDFLKKISLRNLELWCLLMTGAEWHVYCGDIVEIETRSRISIWRTFG